MKCWNCSAEVPENAKFCLRCEADLTEVPPIPPEAEQAIADTLNMLTDDVQAELKELLDVSETADDFANASLIGDCPQCGSSNVGDCETDPDYEDITLGRCFDCGAVWCTDCEHVLKGDEKECPNEGEHIWDLLEEEEGENGKG